MKSKFLSYIIILCLIVTSISLIPTKALYPQPRVDLYEYNINVTSNTNACVEGTVNKAYGQQISVRDASFIPIAIGNVGNSGGKESFRIKIPAAYIKSGSNIFYVYSEAVKGKLARSNSKEFKVNYSTEKQNQTITASNKSVAIGNVVSLGAEASSGLLLSYKSENPSIATVDMNGKVIGRKVGSTKIIISQDGNNQYNAVSKTVIITVTKPGSSAEANKPSTYTIIYHGGSNIGISKVTGKMSAQKVARNKTIKLKTNKFKKKGYQFVGWSISSGRANKNKSTTVEKFSNINMKSFQLGKVKYKNKASVKNLASAGKSIHLYAVWKGDGPEAAVDWATIIAADNNFTYGPGQRAHNHGCYYCGTNRSGKKHAKKWNLKKNRLSAQSTGQRFDKTWCCNPFIGSAYKHGANHSTKRKCLKGNMSASSWTRYNNSDGKFKKISKSAKAKPGDIYYTGRHVWMYAGNGKKLEASGGGWGKNSIRIKKGGKGGANGVLRYYPGK